MAKKITLEDLLDKKLDNGFQSKNVALVSLGGEITIVKQPLTTVMRMVDGMEQSESMSERLTVMLDLIYKCVPLFHSKKLQEKYNVAEPTEVVSKVLDENMGDITKLAEAIMSFYGMDDMDVSTTVKK